MPTLFDFESIDEALRAYRSRFETGRFAFRPGDALRAAVARADVPEAHGVYLIRTDHEDAPAATMYIGRSGTMHRDGTLSRQTLRGRLANRQRGMNRESYFLQYMERHGIAALEFEWFVTFGGPARTLPSLAEKVLLQAHFDRHGALPPMNRVA